MSGTSYASEFATYNALKEYFTSEAEYSTLPRRTRLILDKSLGKSGVAKVRRQFENKTLSFEDLKWFETEIGLLDSSYALFIETLELLRTDPELQHSSLRGICEAITTPKAKVIFNKFYPLKDVIPSCTSMHEVLTLDIEKIKAMFSNYVSSNSVKLLIQEGSLTLKEISSIETQTLKTLLQTTARIDFALYLSKQCHRDNRLFLELISTGIADFSQADKFKADMRTLKKYLDYFPTNSLLLLTRQTLEILIKHRDTKFIEDLCVFVASQKLSSIEEVLLNKIISTPYFDLKSLQKLSICNITIENSAALQSLPTLRMRFWAIENYKKIESLLECGFISQEQLTNPTEDFMAYCESLPPYQISILASRGLTRLQWQNAPEDVKKAAVNGPYSVDRSIFEERRPTEALLVQTAMMNKADKAPPDDTFSHK